MKKSLLLLVAVVFGITVIAQNYSLKPNLKSEQAVTAEKVAFEPTNANNVGQAVKSELPNHSYKNTDFVTVINIGSSANAYSYGYGGGQKSIINVNNDLNMVTNIHRMGGVLDPGGYSGDLGYDISIDGGMTWTNMIEIYTAVNNAGGEYYTDAIRYPNHGVYNPAGNTDPNNAYLTYFAPNLDQSNATDSWGGYSYGRAKIGSAPLDTIRHLLSSHDEYYQYIPDGFCVTSKGDFWAADLNQDWTTGTVAYQGTAIMNHGTWNETTMDWEMEQFLIDVPSNALNDRPAHQKIEFAPDGMTGYMAVLVDNGEVPISDGMSYFPVLYKTTDGGENWSDGIPVAIAGEDGIGGVHQFLSDAEIAELYEAPLPDREEIPFTTAFDFDLSVDAWGNPCIAVVVGVSVDPYTIASGQLESSGYAPLAAFLITSSDGAESFIGYELGRIKTLRGEFGVDYTEDNRIQIARSHDGTKMFVGWLDTDLPGVTDNNQPDIWCRGVDVVTHMLTANNLEDKPNNVTEFSEGMWQAYFGTMANEAFMDGDVYTIPFTYEEMNPEDPGIEVQYKYIQDFAYTEADFIITSIEDDFAQLASFEVGQNFPNPANGTTTVAVTLEETTTLSFELFNMMGQKVFEVAAQSYSTGVQSFTFDASELSSGVYFYTVTAGETQVSKKMIVE